MNYLHKQKISEFSFGFEIPVAGATWWPIWGRAEEMGSEFLGAGNIWLEFLDLISIFSETYLEAAGWNLFTAPRQRHHSCAGCFQAMLFC